MLKSSIFDVYAGSISVGGRLYLRLHLTIRPSDPEHIVIFYEHLLRLISDDGDDDVNRKLVNFKILPEYPFCAPERPPTCFNGLCIYESVS